MPQHELADFGRLVPANHELCLNRTIYDVSSIQCCQVSGEFVSQEQHLARTTSILEAFDVILESTSGKSSREQKKR